MGVHYGIRPNGNASGVVQATGGTETVIEQNGKYYRVHSFTEVGTDTLEVLRGGECDVLVVAGGGFGGEGNSPGSGGGAGGVIITKKIIDKNTHTVVVGDKKQNSEIFDLVSLAGGDGGPALMTGDNGGSGGGQSALQYGGIAKFAGLGLQPTETPNIGYGNNGYPDDTVSRPGGTSTNYVSGGGGGAGAKATNRNGGLGIASSITGVEIYYSGGGAGMRGLGGIGGGGDGGSGDFNIDHDASTSGTPGEPNTGGGGGATHTRHPDQSTRDGGSGIVIIRYRITKSEYEAEG